MHRFAFLGTATISIFLFVACSKKSEPRESEIDSSLAVSQKAIGESLMAKNSLMAYHSQLEAIAASSFTSDTTGLEGTKLAFPIDSDQLREQIEQVLSTASGKVSPERIEQLREIEDQLLGSPQGPMAARTLHNSSSSGALPIFLTSLSQVSATEAPIRLNELSRVGELLNQLEQVLTTVHYQLNNQSQVAGNQQMPLAPVPFLRFFGPSSCHGTIQEGPNTSCDSFVDLKLCLKNDKEKACGGEVVEINCNDNPPAQYASRCAMLGGNTTATCRTRTGIVQDKFAVGFWECKNPPQIPTPTPAPTLAPPAPGQMPAASPTPAPSQMPTVSPVPAPSLQPTPMPVNQTAPTP